MTLHVDYITDIKGKPKAVVIPNNEWQKFTKEYDLLKSKLSILLGVESAIKEVREVKTHKKKGKSFSQFLNEL